MSRSFSTALADARIIVNHDLVELYEHAPILNISDKRCLELLLMWSRTDCIDNITGLNDDEIGYLNWYDDVYDAHQVLKTRNNKERAALFNNQLALDQKQGFRLDEKPATASDLARNNKMVAYGVAAALFNKQLALDHSQGLRLDEKPTTASAIQRALNRPSGIEALARFEEFCKTNGFTSV